MFWILLCHLCALVGFNVILCQRTRKHHKITLQRVSSFKESGSSWCAIQVWINISDWHAICILNVCNIHTKCGVNYLASLHAQSAQLNLRMRCPATGSNLIDVLRRPIIYLLQSTHVHCSCVGCTGCNSDIFSSVHDNISNIQTLASLFWKFWSDIVHIWSQGYPSCDS